MMQNPWMMIKKALKIGEQAMRIGAIDELDYVPCYAVGAIVSGGKIELDPHKVLDDTGLEVVDGYHIKSVESQPMQENAILPFFKHQELTTERHSKATMVRTIGMVVLGIMGSLSSVVIVGMILGFLGGGVFG